jgi:hypothetical protein
MIKHGASMPEGGNRLFYGSSHDILSSDAISETYKMIGPALIIIISNNTVMDV